MDMERTCHICGKKFIGKNTSKYCSDCWTQPCAVCGKPVKLNPTYMTRFVKRGWITCSNKCGNKKRHSAK